jgi:hypothetical protein
MGKFNIANSFNISPSTISHILKNICYIKDVKECPPLN